MAIVIIATSHTVEQARQRCGAQIFQAGVQPGESGMEFDWAYLKHLAQQGGVHFQNS
jgi:hypothetical protein